VGKSLPEGLPAFAPHDDGVPRPVSVSMDIDYNLDDTHALHNQSILIKESNLNDQTILDYRDYMARATERSRSIVVHHDAFITDQGM